MRFRQQFNIVDYAIQVEYSNPIKRKLALEIEAENALKVYVANLKSELAPQVRSLRPKTLNQAEEEALEAEFWVRDI